MIKSACKRMKIAVVSSVALIVTGSLLVLMALLMPLQTVLPVIFTSLGFFSIGVGVLVMAATIVAILLPTVSRQLELCQH